MAGTLEHPAPERHPVFRGAAFGGFYPPIDRDALESIDRPGRIGGIVASAERENRWPEKSDNILLLVPSGTGLTQGALKPRSGLERLLTSGPGLQPQKSAPLSFARKGRGKL